MEDEHSVDRARYRRTNSGREQESMRRLILSEKHQHLYQLLFLDIFLSVYPSSRYVMTTNFPASLNPGMLCLSRHMDQSWSANRAPKVRLLMAGSCASSGSNLEAAAA